MLDQVPDDSQVGSASCERREAPDVGQGNYSQGPLAVAAAESHQLVGPGRKVQGVYPSAVAIRADSVSRYRGFSCHLQIGV
jgi:hypothetical protein